MQFSTPACVNSSLNPQWIIVFLAQSGEGGTRPQGVRKNPLRSRTHLVFLVFLAGSALGPNTTRSAITPKRPLSLT